MQCPNCGHYETHAIVKEALSSKPISLQNTFEVVPPNPWLAFSALAPLVSESLAYLESGRPDAAQASLRNARQVIEQVTQPMTIWKYPEREQIGRGDET